jgi:hypothetical protein
MTLADVYQTKEISRRKMTKQELSERKNAIKDYGSINTNNLDLNNIILSHDEICQFIGISKHIFLRMRKANPDMPIFKIPGIGGVFANAQKLVNWLDNLELTQNYYKSPQK